MVGWHNVAIGFAFDDIVIGGFHIWRHKWRRVEVPPLKLPHPAYPKQIHDYDVYEIGDEDAHLRFAAGELSNGVWGFYVEG